MADTRPAGTILFTLAVFLAVSVLAGVMAVTALAALADGWFVPAIVAAVVAPAAAVLALRGRQRLLRSVPPAILPRVVAAPEKAAEASPAVPLPG